MTSSPQPSDTTSLKSCPFCGSPGIEFGVDDVAVFGCSSEDCAVDPYCETAEQWNTRSQPQSPSTSLSDALAIADNAISGALDDMRDGGMLISEQSRVRLIAAWSTLSSLRPDAAMKSKEQSND